MKHEADPLNPGQACRIITNLYERFIVAPAAWWLRLSSVFYGYLFLPWFIQRVAGEQFVVIRYPQERGRSVRSRGHGKAFRYASSEYVFPAMQDELGGMRWNTCFYQEGMGTYNVPGPDYGHYVEIKHGGGLFFPFYISKYKPGGRLLKYSPGCRVHIRRNRYSIVEKGTAFSNFCT